MPSKASTEKNAQSRWIPTVRRLNIALKVLLRSRLANSIILAARFNGPDRLDLAAAHSDGGPVQVHRGAAVGWNHFAPRTDADLDACRFHGGVFLRQLEHLLGQMVLDRRRTEVLGDPLRPGVQDLLPRPRAHDRCQDRQRAAELRS